MSNEKLIRRHLDALNSRDFVAYDETVSEDLQLHAGGATLPLGREGYRFLIQQLCAAVPDIAVEVHDLVEQGDRVAVRYTERGTNSGGEFLGLPATGREYEKRGMTFYRVADGKIAEGWLQEDDLGVLRDLGYIAQ